MRQEQATAGYRKIGLAALLVGLAGLAAAVALAPDVPLAGAEPARAADLFGPRQLEEMTSFRGPQRLIAVAALVLELLALGALAWWAPGRIARDRSALAGALVAGGIALALALLALPLSVVAFERAREAGLVTQPFLSWLGDLATGTGITLLLAAAGGALAVFLIAKLGRWWWTAGAGAVALYAVLVVWLWPVVVAPLFSDFEPLEEGPARAEILTLAERAGVDVGEVFVVDAGERSTAINAYVTGLGPTKRVVVYDNALAGLERGELRSVLAHELAHVTGRDVQRGVLWVVIVAPFGMLFVHLLASRLAAARGVRLGSAAGIPALAFALSLAVLGLGVIGSGLSRAVEARADAEALALADQPRAFIELQRELAVTNLRDPDPPGLWQAVFASHPSTVERIGMARELANSPDPARGIRAGS